MELTEKERHNTGVEIREGGRKEEVIEHRGMECIARARKEDEREDS